MSGHTPKMFRHTTKMSRHFEKCLDILFRQRANQSLKFRVCLDIPQNRKIMKHTSLDVTFSQNTSSLPSKFFSFFNCFYRAPQHIKISASAKDTCFSQIAFKGRAFGQISLFGVCLDIFVCLDIHQYV